MTNSMNKDLAEILTIIEKHFQIEEHNLVMANQLALDLNRNDIHQALILLKAEGFRQLSILTCVDWIKENKFQLVFNIFNWEKAIRIQLRTKINRENPTFTTITSIYPGAKYYERDVHEFFGVVFEGNEDALKQLFLENWDSIPPLRKDFISREYSDKKYSKREYKWDFSEKAGEK